MTDKPIQWEIIASMDAIQKEHPYWTEDQCQEEMSRLASLAVEKMLDERGQRKRKRKPL
jgi:hypothetical protein